MKKYTLIFALALFVLPLFTHAQVINVKLNVINDGAGTLSASDFYYNVGHAGTDGINTGRQWGKAVWATADFKSTEIEHTSPNPVTWPVVFPVTYSIFTTSGGDRIYGTMNTKEQERNIEIYWKENGGSITFSEECNGMIDIDQTKNCTITINDGQYKVGQLNIRYTFIGSYSLPVNYTVTQKLSNGSQQAQGGTSQGNPGYTLDIPFDSLNPDAQEYYVTFQPVSPFILQMSGDCEGQIPLASETKNCLATFRLPPPPAPVQTPTPSPTPAPTPIQSTPPCSQDVWSCGDYGICSVAGIQSRSCTKTLDCPSVQTATPTTDKSCQPQIQPQPTQINQVKQDLATNSVLEKISPKKSVTTPVVTNIENKEQTNTKKEKIEEPKAPLNVINQNTASSTAERKEVAKPFLITRIIRWFLGLF